MTAGAPQWREPWALHEDDDVLVVAKPAGVSTRTRGRHGQDGMVEWVRRQRRGTTLQVAEELAREASGELVLTKRAGVDVPPATASSPPSPATPCDVAHAARLALFDPDDTDAYLWVDRHHDGLAGVRVERLGPVALAIDYRDRSRDLPPEWLDGLLSTPGIDAVFVQHRPRRGPGDTARLVAGAQSPRFDVVELGVRYRVDLEASATSSGLFVDQRETRRELLSTSMHGTTLLNTFAHTGAFSVAAGLAGAETLTLDLSKHYLDWARENFRLNGLDPGEHDFVYGDALDWMGRFSKRGRRFDVVIADPPTSSTARKGSKRWNVGSDLHELVRRTVALCAPGGRAYVSTNFRKMGWTSFLDHVDRGLAGAGRGGRVETRTLPLDHRSDADDPPYLKAAWLHLDT